MVKRAFVPMMVLAAALSFSAASLAKEPTAKERFNKGVKLFKQEDHAGALAEFLAAYKASPHYSVLFNIAQCHAAIENNGEALSYFQQYLDEAGDSIPTQRKVEVVEEMDRIKKLLCALDVKVSPPYAETLIDGKVVEDVSKTIYLDPGEHTLTVQMEGHVPFSETIVLTRGEPQTRDITLQPAATTGTLIVKSDVEDAYVYMDGEQVGPAPWEGTLEPGTHTVAVKAMEREDATDTVEVILGETVTVKLDPAPPVEAGGTAQPVDVKMGPKPRKLAIGAGVTAGIAFLSLSGTITAGVVALMEHRRLEDCHKDLVGCSVEEEDDTIHTGETSRNAFNVGLGVTLALSALTISLGAAAGALHKKEKQSQLVLTPYYDGAGGGGLSVQGVF
jgi:hypothetical protein